MSAQEKGAAFRALHEGEPFVIPNPWDAGAARVLESLGFQALATTSSGFAYSLGRADGSVSLDEVAAHIRALDAATSLPISVDLENGYGPAPHDAAPAIPVAAWAGPPAGRSGGLRRDPRPDPPGHRTGARPGGARAGRRAG